MKNYGFIADVITAEHYVLGDGNVPQVVLQENGHGWGSFLPFDKVQEVDGVEPMACSTYGTLNAIEMLIARLYGQKPDYSDRYTAITSGTTASGNSPQTVVESIRTRFGLIEDSLLPEGAPITNFSEWYSPNPMTALLLVHGYKWLQDFVLLHDWVITSNANLAANQAALIQALQYSPVGVAVFAWVLDPVTGYYTAQTGDVDNHWCVLWDYVEGQYWIVFDSYDNTHKNLAWDYPFGFAKRYYIQENVSTPVVGSQNGNWLTDIINSFGSFLKDIAFIPS